MEVAILGIPMDLGAGRRGVDMGASALRNARIKQHLQDLGHSVTDLGNIPVEIADTFNVLEQSGMVFLDPIYDACKRTYDVLLDLPENVFPICMGGDHSVSMGTVAGCARGERTGLIWVDAHTDFNTPETSPTGNIHGMPVAHLCGIGHEKLLSIAGAWQIRPEDIVMIGIRSVDSEERRLIKEHGITVYTMREVDMKGISRIAEETLKKLGHLKRIHVSFDADGLDPTLAPGVGTPVEGGLTYREAHLLMELFADSGKITSMDIVEVNPILDEKNRTAQVMVEMAGSLLGKRIL
ncbi:arginase [Deinococcus roseus]|uniref:Arginase n=1 Tax=Deinococcus roseus TaxID=392414 RepID=A0ABQ2CZW8_9DEIO|nr:arginase [Deinococcus roseus]GGJ37058.1 arginase [Deinococcus roseus]